jgi:uncharacterized protein (TIGR04255 family)
MPLPKRITPDNIIDAAVEIKYLSNLPFEVLIGIFFNAFDETYRYTSRPLQPNLPFLPFNPALSIAFSTSSQPVFYNDHFSIRLLSNSIIFGCLNNKYIGWESYKTEIEKVLRTLAGTGHITTWIRIGIRYISEYLKKDLKEFTKFDFTFGLPEVQSLSTTFRSEFGYKDAKVVLNLNNMVPTIRQQSVGNTAELVETSIIDVDVIKDPLAINEVTELMDAINATHDLEKELFFNLLTEKFLTTLNPIY